MLKLKFSVQFFKKLWRKILNLQEYSIFEMKNWKVINDLTNMCLKFPKVLWYLCWDYWSLKKKNWESPQLINMSHNTLPSGRIATGHATIIMYKGHIWVHCGEGHRVNQRQFFLLGQKYSPIGNPQKTTTLQILQRKWKNGPKPPYSKEKKCK